jgi:glutamate synthase (NADPH/NADH) small chain
LNLVKEKNVLPGICGRVCPQENQCEAECALGRAKGSQPVAIGRLERYIADWDILNPENGEGTKPALEKSNNIKVAVVGSGPAGLTLGCGNIDQLRTNLHGAG